RARCCRLNWSAEECTSRRLSQHQPRSSIRRNWPQSGSSETWREHGWSREAFDSAGIECILGDQNMVRMDWFISNLLGGIKLQVKRDDVEEALALLDEEVPKSCEVEG